MKRYKMETDKIGLFELDRDTLITEDPQGEWVKWEDVKHLLSLSGRLDKIEKRITDIEKPPIPTCLDCGRVLENINGILPGAWARQEIGKPIEGFVCNDCHNSGG